MMISHYISLMRPTGWAPFIFAVVFGLLDSGLDPQKGLIMLVIWGPLLLGSVMSLNFYSDIRTDSFNKFSKDVSLKSQPLAANKISKPKVLIFSAYLSVAGLIASFFLGFTFFMVSLIFFLLQAAYSVGPRLKSVPFADVLDNGASAALSYLAPMILAGSMPQLANSLWVFFLICAFFVISAALDFAADKKAGSRTVAVALGVRKATILGFALYLVSLPFYIMSLGRLHYYLIIPAIIIALALYCGVVLGRSIERFIRMAYILSLPMIIALLVLYFF